MTITVNFAFLGTQGAHVGGAENNIERLPQVSLTILLGTVLLALITLAVSAAFSKQIPSTAAAMLLGLLPLVGNILSDDDSWTQIIEAFPVNMIFGSYIGGIRYVFLTDMLFDLRLLFFPVAVVTVAVCLPLIYTQYCRHQVKN